MYCLVRFIEDNVFHVCQKEAVRGRFVKWIDGYSYKAKQISESRCRTMLEEISSNLKIGVPFVQLRKIDSMSCKINLMNEFSRDTEIPDEGKHINILSNEIINIANENPVGSAFSSDVDPYETDGDSSYHPSDISDKHNSGAESCYVQSESLKNQNTHADSSSTLSQAMDDVIKSAKCFPTLINSLKNDNTVVVAHEDSTNPYGKKKTKQHCCFICQKLETKLPKHFLIHKNVEEVDKVLSLPKGSAERRSKLYELQKRGDFDYNAGKSNQIITVRSQLKSNIHRDSVPCPYCKGYYSSNNVRNHIRLKCRPNREQKRNLKVLSRSLRPKVSEIANGIMKHSIFPKFRDDSVTDLIRYDELIITFGNMLCIKYSTSSHHHKMIRTRLRHLGKVLQMAKSLNFEISDTASLFNPKYFDTVTKAIQELAGLNYSKGEYRAPSSATTSCTLLLQVGEMAKFEAIKSGDAEMEKRVDNFIFLLQKSMNPLINKVAIENRTQRQRQKLVILPKTEDVSNFFMFLCGELKHSVKKINNHFDLKTWEYLAKCTLTLVMIFNRKRPGEIERAHLLDYENFEIINEDRKSCLVHEKKGLAEVFGRFRIRGKLNRNVPVVISNVMKLGLDTLLKFRNNACVPVENKYLFGKCDPNRMAVDISFSANVALTELKANIPGAKNITPTKLRKHLATISNDLNLDDRALDNVTDFMGHNTSVHKNIYRQIPAVRDIVDVAPVLNTAVGITGHEAHSIDDDSDSTKRHSKLYFSTTSDITCSEEAKNNENHPSSKRRRVMTTASIPRRSWNTPEKIIMRDLFSDEISKRQVPTLMECTDAIMRHKVLENRTPKQIQLWLLSESTRNTQLLQGKSKNGWTTPEKKACRKYFHQYYNTKSYPSNYEIQQVIEQVPELKNRTPRRTKSHLQHDMKYMSKRRLSV